MLKQLFIGGLASLCNIAIHALVMTVVIRVARRAAQRYRGERLPPLVVVMAGTIAVLMAAHSAEVVVWGIAYGLVNAVSDETARFYFAFVNYTTLGYGDVVPVKEWQLLGPITAMNGILLFGWSTAVIFEVLQRALLLEDAVKARPSVAAE
jgi:hypothetical protein